MEWMDLVTRVAELAGVSRGDAERALRATTSSLAEALFTDEAEALSRELPAELRSLARGRAVAAPLGPAALAEQVALREAVALGFAHEHAECACRALAEGMSPDLRARLQRHLPRLESLLDPRDTLRDASSESVAVPVHGSTLATGHPGSRHPLSEARPDGRIPPRRD